MNSVSGQIIAFLNNQTADAYLEIDRLGNRRIDVAAFTPLINDGAKKALRSYTPEMTQIVWT